MLRAQPRKLSLRFGNGRVNGRSAPGPRRHRAAHRALRPFGPVMGTDAADRRRRVGDHGPGLVTDHPVRAGGVVASHSIRGAPGRNSVDTSGPDRQPPDVRENPMSIELESAARWPENYASLPQPPASGALSRSPPATIRPHDNYFRQGRRWVRTARSGQPSTSNKASRPDEPGFRNSCGAVRDPFAQWRGRRCRIYDVPRFVVLGVAPLDRAVYLGRALPNRKPGRRSQGSHTCSCNDPRRPAQIHHPTWWLSVVARNQADADIAHRAVFQACTGSVSDESRAAPRTRPCRPSAKQ